MSNKGCDPIASTFTIFFSIYAHILRLGKITPQTVIPVDGVLACLQLVTESTRHRDWVPSVHMYPYFSHNLAYVIIFSSNKFAVVSQSERGLLVITGSVASSHPRAGLSSPENFSVPLLMLTPFAQLSTYKKWSSRKEVCVLLSATKDIQRQLSLSVPQINRFSGSYACLHHLKRTDPSKSGTLLLSLCCNCNRNQQLLRLNTEFPILRWAGCRRSVKFSR